MEWGRKYKAIANIYAYVDDLIICNTKLSNGETGKIKNRGIIQGYKISPSLFNIIIYKSTKKLNKTF